MPRWHAVATIALAPVPALHGEMFTAGVMLGLGLGWLAAASVTRQAAPRWANRG